MARSPSIVHRPRPMNVYVLRGSLAEKKYQARAGVPGLDPQARAPGVPAAPRHDLLYHGGKTLQHMTFTNFYVGGDAWQASDMHSIDRALEAAMAEPTLNSVMGQYFSGTPTTSFVASTSLPGPARALMSQGDVEELALSLLAKGKLSQFDLATTVFNFMLPRGTVLTDSPIPGADEGMGRDRLTGQRSGEDEDSDSMHGLGGYHGSISRSDVTLYYAVGVYSETFNGRTNGIPAFAQPWKNVVATFYHELNEARTDPDVGQVINGGSRTLLGWTSLAGEECGDFPIADARELSHIFREVPLTGGGTAPVQFMYSDRVHGPEGPRTSLDPAASLSGLK